VKGIKEHVDLIEQHLDEDILLKEKLGIVS
jgi:hypothetical protein